MPGTGNSSTGNRGRFKCCRKGYDYQSHDSASRPAGIQGHLHCISQPGRTVASFSLALLERTPSADRMAIFDRSWYRSLLDAQINGIISEADLKKAYADVRNFERQMRDGGTIILKFFLEVSKKEQAARLAALQSNPATAWRVSDAVLQRHGRYKDYQDAVEQMFSESDVEGQTPWTRVPSKNTKEATLKVLNIMVSVLRKRVEEVKEGTPALLASNRPHRPLFRTAPSLAKVDLGLQLSKEEYREMLAVRQRKIQDLHHEVYRLRIPVVIVYEGWDAAGKGGIFAG